MPRRPKNRTSSAGGDDRVAAAREKAAPADSRGWWRTAAFALLPAIFLAQGAWFIAANSQTYDEAVNLCAGYSYLADGDFRFNAEHPPLMKESAALPLWLCYRPPLPTDMLSPKWDAEWVVGRRFPRSTGPAPATPESRPPLPPVGKVRQSSWADRLVPTSWQLPTGVLCRTSTRRSVQ
jgi:hypothetical protein